MVPAVEAVVAATGEHVKPALGIYPQSERGSGNVSSSRQVLNRLPSNGRSTSSLRPGARQWAGMPGATSRTVSIAVPKPER